MKSFNEADRAEREINRLVFLASLLAMAAGVSTNAPAGAYGDAALEMLAAGRTCLWRRRSEIFSAGRRNAGGALLEPGVCRDARRDPEDEPRAAGVGTAGDHWANGKARVSHDLRHYLAAVYANAEFLASPALPANERQELFEEIRLAVNGTTDMLDSLLIFGRTGTALRREPTTLTSLVERAVALVRTHPDAERASPCDWRRTTRKPPPRWTPSRSSGPSITCC